MLSTISQIDRPDFVGRHATVEVSRDSFGDGNLSLSVTEASNIIGNEVNFNASVAWFDYAGGWLGAHVNGNGTLASANRVTQSMVTKAAAGRYRINLGPGMNEGMLFTIGNNNNLNTVVQTAPIGDGSQWDVRVSDTASSHGATGKDRDFSFVYLPLDLKGLDGENNTDIMSSGEFEMTRLGTGRYELMIPGEDPTTGMLILNVHSALTQAGVTAPDDNYLVYQASPTGSFLINSYDLPSSLIQDTKFTWAFMSYKQPLTNEIQLADFNDDSIINGRDLLEWQRQHSTTPANLNSFPEALKLWQRQYGRHILAHATTNSIAVPEPSSGVLSVAYLAAYATARRRRAE
jgi:hypothetical protein